MCLLVHTFVEALYDPDIICFCQLKGFEFIKGVHLDPVPFDMERGLMTPTFKKKRPELLKYYQVQILKDLFSIIEFQMECMVVFFSPYKQEFNFYLKIKLYRNLISELMHLGFCFSIDYNFCVHRIPLTRCIKH